MHEYRENIYAIAYNIRTALWKAVETYAEGNARKKSRQKLFWLLPAENML